MVIGPGDAPRLIKNRFHPFARKPKTFDLYISDYTYPNFPQPIWLHID